MRLTSVQTLIGSTRPTARRRLVIEGTHYTWTLLTLIFASTGDHTTSTRREVYPKSMVQNFRWGWASLVAPEGTLLRVEDQSIDQLSQTTQQICGLSGNPHKNSNTKGSVPRVHRDENDNSPSDKVIEVACARLTPCL